MRTMRLSRQETWHVHEQRSNCTVLVSPYLYSPPYALPAVERAAWTSMLRNLTALIVTN